MRGRKIRVKNAPGLVLSPDSARDAVDPMQLAAARFAPRTTSQLAEWARDKTGTWLTPQQETIDASLQTNRYTAVPSCHASGKSRFSATKSGHFIDSHPLGSAFFVSTAPSSAQVEGVLWRELRRVHAAAKLRGRITRSGFPQWHIGDELVGFGRRPRDMTSVQGIHARYIFIVIEEADGIPEELWTAMDTLTSSGVVRVLAIGNPDSGDTHFARVCKPGSGWNVVRIDGLLTPNMTEREVRKFPDLYQYFVDNRIPFSDSSIASYPLHVRQVWRESLLSPEWVAERMPRWGVQRFIDEKGKVRWRESALWQSKVRGMTPEQGSEGAIPLSWVERAMNRWDEWQASGAKPAKGRLIVGCDVADSGKDETVMPLRRGNIVERLNRIGQQDTETTALRIAGSVHSEPGAIACVDASGVGVGVYNNLRRRKVRVIGFVGASKAVNRDATNQFTFANLRSAAYWNLRELLDPLNGPDDVCLPRDADLLADLTVPTWTIRTGAVIAVEPKESVVKRLGRSPDCGDAVVMCFWPSSTGAAAARIVQYSEPAFDDEWEDSTLLQRPASQATRRREERLVALTERQARGSNVYSYSDSSSEGEW